MLLRYSAVRPFFHFGASLSKQQSVNGKNLILGGMFMENKLKNYFPLIRERKEVLKEISDNSGLQALYQSWEPEWQE